MSKYQTDQFEAQTDVSSSQTDQFEKELDKILRFAELISLARTHQFGGETSVWLRGNRNHQFDATLIPAISLTTKLISWANTDGIEYRDTEGSGVPYTVQYMYR